MTRSLSVAAAAAAWFLVTATPAHAQPARGPYLPPDAKGQATVRMMQAWQASGGPAAVSASHPVRRVPVAPVEESAAAVVQIAITVPPGTGTTPAAVAIRGPEGEVRTFPVEGGREALQSRVIVVRPGQSVTIRYTPAK